MCVVNCPPSPRPQTMFTSSCARSYLRCTFVVDFRNMRRSARPCERRSDGKGETERKHPIAVTSRTLSMKVCVRHRLPDALSTQNVPRCSFDFHRTNTCTGHMVGWERHRTYLTICPTIKCYALTCIKYCESSSSSAMSDTVCSKNTRSNPHGRLRTTSTDNMNTTPNTTCQCIEGLRLTSWTAPTALNKTQTRLGPRN